jgi:hypothetical protein
MPDYNNGKIYKIECFITGEIYIGSTCEPTLARRLAKHVSDCKRWRGDKGRKTTSFDIIERGDYKIILIEKFICNSKDELTARESHYIKEYKLIGKCINKRIESRTAKEWRQENAEAIKEKKYIPFVCDCGTRYLYVNRSRHFRTKNHLKFVDKESLD